MPFDDSLIGNDDFDPRAATESLIRQVSDIPPGGPVDVRALNTRLARKLGQPQPTAAPEASSVPAAAERSGALDFSAQAAPPPPTDVTDTSLDFSAQAAPPLEAAPPAAPSLGISGQAAAFAKGIPAGALEGTGGVIQGLGTMGVAAQSSPALQDVAAANDLSNTFPAQSQEALAAQQAFEAKIRENAKSIDDNALVRAGKAVKQFGSDHIPMSAAEKDSIGGRVGHGIGTIAPYAAATVLGGPELGIAAGFSGMAADTYGTVYEKALDELNSRGKLGVATFNNKEPAPEDVAAAKEVARSAATKAALVSGVLGSLPLGAGKYAKGLIAKVASSSAAFATAGEAQEAILQQIAKDYDPKAGYTFEQKRLIAELILGAGMGGLHHAFDARKEAAPRAADAPQPDAGTSPGPNPGGPDVGTAGPQPGAGGPDVGTNGPRPGGTGEGKGPDFTMDAKTRSKMERVYRHFEPDADPAKMSDADLFNALNEHLRDTSKTGYTAKPETAEEVAAREGAATERTERDALKRRGWTDAHIDAMTPEQRRQYFQEAMAGESTRRPEDAASTAQAQPEAQPKAKPEQTTVEAQPEPASHLEHAVLREYGYSADDISSMSPKQRRREVQDAYASGVKPGAAMQKHQPPPRATSESDVGTGTREEPIKATAAEDVLKAQPVEPTPAQATAENYKHAHVELEQLGLTGKNSISIETGIGQERKGTSPDGKEWSVTLEHAAYGRIKGTKGADGQPLDIFVGPHPTSPHVFVVDQHHPEGGFDEHKVLAGFLTPIDALHAYANSYTDKAEGRIGGVTAMTPDDFKSWLKGDTTLPLKTQPPASEPVKAEAGGLASTEAPGTSASVPKETPAAIGAEAAGSKPATPKPANRSDEPTSLLQFIASRGGLAPHPELDALDVGDHRAQIPGRKGFFGVVRPTGMSLDLMREAAEEAGYFRGEHNKTSTVRDFLDAIDNELRGQRHAVEGEEGKKTKRQRTSEAESSAAARDKAVAVAHDDIAAEYADLPPDLHAKAAEIMADERLDVDSAVEQAALRMVSEDADYGVTPNDITDTFGEGALDEIRPRQASEDGRAATPASGQERRSGESEEAGEHGERVPDAGAKRGEVQSESTEAGEQQVIPGAGKIGDGEQAQRAADKPLKPTKPQKPADVGLFSDEKDQGDLLDAMARKVPAVRENLFVNIEGRRFPLTSYEEASRAYSEAIDRTGATASGQTGPQAPQPLITDDKGKVVGWISYNGRVWSGDPNNFSNETVKMLYDPRGEDDPYERIRQASDTIELALGDDADKVAPVDIARAAELMSENEGMDVPTAFGHAVIETAVDQGFITEPEAIEAYGKEAKDLLATGREGASGSGENLERGGPASGEISAGSAAQTGVVPGRGEAGEGGQAAATGRGTADDTAAAPDTTKQPAADGQEGANRTAAEGANDAALKDWSKATTSELAEFAAGFGGEGLDEAGERSPTAYRWTFDPAYPLSKLNYADLVRDAKEEMQVNPRSFVGMEKPIHTPIIVVEESGKSYLWDGAHRIAASTLSDRQTIPAIIGLVADQETPTLQAGESDGIPPRLHERDAGAEPEAVPEAAGLGRTGPLRGVEGARGVEDVSGVDQGRAEGERLSDTAVREGSRGAGEGGDVRVSGRHGDEQAGRNEGSDGREARAVKGENYRIAPGSLAEDRSPRTKATDNIQAIKVANRIVDEGRPATAAEQHQLARYVGWGGIKNAFPDAGGEIAKGFEKIAADLKEILTPEEYDTARRSIQYAHYTAEDIISGMWGIAERLGFKGGHVFEPGMGVGHFAGLMPADIAEHTVYNGVEMDHVTARIAALLYPKWGVRREDFTKMPLAENAFDLVIGNPPFASINIKSDPKYPQGFLLHDYFFAKSLDGVRPGGVLAFVTSAGTMNKIDPSARKYLADRADLVGAIRLPLNAFKKNAGTEVTTDIVILRKRLPGEAAGDRTWTETAEVTLPGPDGKPMKGQISRYFAEHPEMVLGKGDFADKLYEGRYSVKAWDNFDLKDALAVAASKLPRNVMSEPETPQHKAEADFEGTEKKDGSYYIKDGRLMQQRAGAGYEVERRGKGVEGGKTAAELERIRGLVPIRDALRATFAADLADDAAVGKIARAKLNKAYDAFVEKFGPINKAEIQRRRPNTIQQEAARAEAREEARYAGVPFDEGSFDAARLADAGKSLTEIARARKAAREEQGDKYREGSFDPEDMPDTIIDKRPNIEPFAEDQENYRLRAIENYDEPTGKGFKGAVFSRNIITKDRAPEIKSISDAVLYVLNQKGRLDIDAIGAMVGKSHSEAIEALGDRIYQVPGTKDAWETREKYLSGNVRKKLTIAKAESARNPVFRRNVEALEAAQPAPLAPSQIGASLGMPWIPVEVVEQFGKEAMGLSAMKVRYSPVIASWAVSGDTDSVAATSTWGTPRRNATALLLDALNRQTPKIYDEGPEKGQRTLNIVATQAAQDKMQAIRDKFNEWIFSDEKRADRLASFYNENYNNLVVQDFDGSYLTTPGVSSEWTWRPHQKRVVARIIQDGNTYVAHAVGAGKTSDYIAAAMEMRRLGLVHKPMHVVPNHMLAQFTKEFYELYPTARIMVADERQFHTDRRKQFMANVALEDLDSVIITHSAFGMIPVSDEFQDSIIEKELDEYRHALADTPKDGDNRITRSRIEKQIERLEQRLSGRTNRKRDAVFNFDEMGVDFMFVDEAQEFRKLDFNTQMSNLKGITPQGSGKAWDLYVKSRLLDQRNPGRSLVLGSGTPVTNTMAELYTVSRYLQRRELEERQLLQFDAWAGAFGENVSELEQDAAGGYKTVSRFAKFVNVAELSAMVRQVMDVVTSRQLEQYVTRPKLKGGVTTMNMADKSPALERYQAHLAARMKAMEGRGRPKPGDDIMLKVIGDGRHAAIDMRLVGGEHDPDFPSKLDLLIDNAFNIWKRTKQQKFYRPGNGGYDMSKPIDVGPATQMIFANLGISGVRGFSVPDYIRAELVRRGVPRAEVAFIADYKSHVAKQKLFNDMNEAKVRFMIGSTAKMGTGVNAQRRLYATHNLDPLWYPADDEQRNGRALRQGNWNPEIERHAYSTKGTYDSTMWGMMEKKARFIQGFFEGDPSMRVMDDLGEASEYEQAKALTTNDPRLMKLTDLRQQYERANRRKAAFDNEAYAMRRRRAASKSDIEYYEARASGIEKDIAQRMVLAGDNFTAKIGKETFGKRVDFGEALLATMDKIATPQNNGRSMPIGEISGFSLVAKVQKIGDHMSVTLDMKRNGGSETHVNVGTSALGAVRSMESVLGTFDADLAHTQGRIADAKKYLADSEGKQNDKFTGGAEIESLGDQIRALQTELSKKDEPKPPPQEAEDDALAASLSDLAITKTPEIESLIQAAMRHLVGDSVKVDLHDGLIPMNASADKKWAGMPSYGARGMYFPWRRLVQLAMIHGVDSAAFHEAYHVIEYQLQTPAERALMERETPRLRDYIERTRKGYTREQIDALAPEEVRAIAFEDYATDRSKDNAEAGRGTHMGVRRWFDRLWQALKRLANGLRGLGFKTYEDIFDKAYRGEYAKAEGATPRPEVGPEGEALASIFRRQQNQAVNTRLKDLMLSTAWNRLVERYQNLSEPVKRLQEAVEARSNGTLPDTKAFYTKKRLFPGKVGVAVQDFNKEHLDPLIEFAKENQLSLEQVGDIAYALHAPERNAEMETINHPALDGSDASYVGRRSGMSNAEAAAILAEHSPAVINEIDHRLGAIRDFNLNTMVDAGLESQATADAWKAKYQHYAPLSGWDVAPDDAPDTTRGVGNFNVRGPETKRAFGRRTKAANPLVNILDQSYRSIDRAKRNEYVRSAALALGALDEAEQKGFVRFDRGEPKKIIDPRTGLVRITENSAYRSDPAAVGYKVGGNQKYMIFENRDLGEAIKRMHADGLGMFQPLLDIQNKIKAMWTHYSPEFLIRHFLFRYPIEGTLNSFEQGAGQVPQYVKEAIPFLGRASKAIFAHNKGAVSSNPDVAQMQQYYREMREHGGSMTFRSMRDQDLLTEHLKSKLNSLNRSTWASVKDKHQGMVEAMDVVTNALDNSLRLAAYAAGRRQGKTPEQSALLARDATVDFQLAGKWKNAIGLIFPFGNIAIQTGVRMTSAVARSRTMRRVFMGTMLAGFLAGMFNYLIGGDDEDGIPFMDKIPEWERRLNFTVMNPWHRDAKGRPIPIHIPMPYNWAFPLTIGHAMATMVFGKDKHRIKHMLGMVAKSGLEVMTPFGQEENLAALLAPELTRPFIHAYTNKNYNGVPVHQDPAFQRKPSSESGRKTTGDGWKYIASAMNAATGGDKRHAGALDFYPEDYRLMFDYVLGGQRRFIENSVNSAKNAADGTPTDYSKLPLSRVIMGTDYDAADRARRFERKDAAKHPWK